MLHSIGEINLTHLGSIPWLATFPIIIPHLLSFFIKYFYITYLQKKMSLTIAFCHFWTPSFLSCCIFPSLITFFFSFSQVYFCSLLLSDFLSHLFLLSFFLPYFLPLFSLSPLSVFLLWLFVSFIPSFFLSFSLFKLLRPPHTFTYFPHPICSPLAVLRARNVFYQA